MAQTAKNLVRRRVQINHLPPAAQPLAVKRPQNRPTAGGQHTLMGLRQFINDVFFNIPKTLFTLTLKVFPDRATEALLNDLIRINKGKLKPPGELTPDGGFTGAGEAYQTNQKLLVVAKPPVEVAVTRTDALVQLGSPFKMMA